MTQGRHKRAEGGCVVSRSEAQLDAFSQALTADDWLAAEQSLDALRKVIVQVDIAERGPLLQRAQALVERARSEALDRRLDIANRCAVLQLGKAADACYRSVSA